ncbi:MAG: tryptophan--tRNA ligase [Candidatus Moranbacteria bacterium CG_4_9_14_3_um_filter_42_9]|nr:MAG: tryptophan--tRNA ligase [Candidatus Moranbacteria bacterium CG_4_9_14_3_um_filter_42_9]
MSKQRIFSGIQPSGNLHLGNYLGAIKNWVKLQNDFDSIFCVVDLHAITVPQDPEKIRKKIIEVAKIYLACGIDPKKSAIFIQSHVPEHAELCWILNTLVKISELERMTQFKDKSAKNKEGVGMGLFDYPVLMAADILLYDTQVVPVGEDQLQHIEITRTLANRFNKKFGETFVIPEPFITREGMRIMGLDDPAKKMSKSAESEYNYIALTDSEEAVRRKIKKAVTDSGTEIKYTDDPPRVDEASPRVEAGKPALKNLINIYSLLSDKKPQEIEELYAGKGYAEFKEGLAEVVVDFLRPFQEKYNALTDEEVLKILQAGAEKVRPLARKKLEEVKKKVGFIL